VKSVVNGNNADLMFEVAKLWIPPDAQVFDITYGRGLFWSKIQRPRFDLIPFRGNFTKVPTRHYDKYDMVVYDPPYVSIGGRETQREAGREMSSRYGMDLSGSTPLENKILMFQGFVQAWRCARRNGLVMVKCADYISSNKLVRGPRDVQDMADFLYMEQVDEFVLVSGTGPQPRHNLDGTPRRQNHSHHAHSTLCIFKKKRG
jgi:hypothetical protein